MKYNKTTLDAFFSLLRAGLWEQSVQLSAYEPVVFSAIQKLAEDQSVVGIIAAGLEHVTNRKITKQVVLQFVGQALQLEERNKAMNYFIGVIVDKMRNSEIRTLLVKGQGIAQCYERPLWRSSGDVDLLLDEENFQKAKEFLIPLASFIGEEDGKRMHLGLTIGPWLVELHGTLREPLLKRVNNGLDDVQKDTFVNNRIRVWKNGETDVQIPCADNDVIFVFAHILQHYFGGGVGLRQICDWTRLLWTYHKSIDIALLRDRLVSMGLMTEWQVFCAYAIAYLGAPKEAMLLYDGEMRWVRKANRMNRLVIRFGNFGQGRDLSYYQTKPYLIRKAISFTYRISDAYKNLFIFPKDSLTTFFQTFTRGMKAAIRGKY